MIRLAKILDHIRISKNIQRKNLIKFLGMKEAEYTAMLCGWTQLNLRKIKMICEFIDLKFDDYDPLIQRLEREKLFYTLKSLRHFKDLDDPAIQAITDAIYFKVEGSLFNHMLYSAVLDKIYAVPQEIRIAIEEIRTSKNRRSEQ